jgi:uncharacterized protein YuzE
MEYDPVTDMLTVRLENRPYGYSETYGDVILDYTEEGELSGFRIFGIKGVTR